MLVQPNISAAERQAGAQSRLSLRVNLRCGRANRRFQFHEPRQFFIRVHNEPLSVAAMRVRDKDGSPVGIHGCDAAPTPTGLAEIVSDDFPVFPLLIVANGLRCGLTRFKSATERTR
jgi:hypothetical protein